MIIDVRDLAHPKYVSEYNHPDSRIHDVCRITSYNVCYTKLLRACGKFLTAESIIKILDDNGVDKVVLVPGELNSKSEYSLPDIASVFPGHNVVKITNYMTRFVMMLTGKVKDIPAGNEYVYGLKTVATDRIIQFSYNFV